VTKIETDIESPEDPILQEDLDILAETFPFPDSFRNCVVMVTGATGYLGSLIIKSILCSSRKKRLGVKVVGLARNTEKVKSIFGSLSECEDLNFVFSDLTEPFPIDIGHIDYAFHTAAVTESSRMVSEPVETIRASVIGTDNALSYTAAYGCKSMVYLSSMEVYGTRATESELTKETDLGVIDLTSVRSSYPESKRLCELLCLSYAKEYSLDVKIARLAQTFGAGVLSTENRVFAQFARQAVAGKDIVLHTDGSSEGNYCYSRDAIAGLFTILFQGSQGEVYNVANEANHMTILEMANLVAEKVAIGRIGIVVDIPQFSEKLGYAPKTKLKLSSEKLRNLDWAPSVSMEESFQRMIDSMAARHLLYE